MYKAYLKERSGRDTVERHYGFAVYSITNQECYLEDIFVLPPFRRGKNATNLADEVVKIAKEQGCKVLTGSVATNAHNAHSSLLVLLSYGMKLLRAEANLVYFYKEI